jgi:hypothetical protein
MAAPTEVAQWGLGTIGPLAPDYWAVFKPARASYAASMTRTHPALWGFGLAGLFSGALLTAIGIFGAGDSASLAGGYGLLMIGSAVYLLGGLKLRERLSHRTSAATAAASSTRSTTPAISAQS